MNKSIANGASFANGNGINGQSGYASGIHTSGRRPFGENWELLGSGRTTFWELI